MQRTAKAITNDWWLFVLEGFLAIAFGVATWVWPGLTVGTFVILYGAFAFATGIMSLAAAGSARRMGESPWGFVFRGLLGIGASVLVVVWPDISALALLYVIAFWAIATGIFQIAASIELRKLIDNEWFLALSGIASVAFGVLAIVFPGDGAVAIAWTIGIYAVAFGSLLIGLGIRLHSLGRHMPSPAV